MLINLSIMNTILYKKSKGRARVKAIEQGAYDGRFRTKIVIDRKKNQYKKFRKEKFKLDNL